MKPLIEQPSNSLKMDSPLASSSQESVSPLYSFWKFSRPHTVIGTSFSILGLYLTALALSSTSFSVAQLGEILAAWIACLGGNIYIVGLNQLEDVEIDKINKPHLPLAAGEFSRKQAQIIVAVSGLLALTLGIIFGPFLLATVGLSLAIGTAYSLPPIRLKRFPFWAAICIFSVRGAIVNLGLFLHFNWVLSQKPDPRLSLLTIPAEVWTLTLFILGFAIAIALFKDIPDLEGDRQYNITTFTLKLGKPAVFKLSLWILTICYLGLSEAGVLLLSHLNLAFLLITHLVALSLMWIFSFNVDLQDKATIARFYQFIWKLFFLEYLIFPLACLLY